MLRIFLIFLIIPFIINRALAGSLCPVDSLLINTGFNHDTFNTYPIGDGDPNWIVVSDPRPLTSEPRPARIINKHAAWMPAINQSMWISSDPDPDNNLTGAYVFEYKFCMNVVTSAELSLSLRVDDHAKVFLNGDLIMNTFGQGNTFNRTIPFNVFINDVSKFNKGQNLIRVEVYNTGGIAMGLNITGTLKAIAGAFVEYSCCNKGGIILGKKWNDMNGDGVKQNTEPLLQGWTIKLSNNMTTTTDMFGNYYFFHVPPGTYTLSELNQPHWTQTFPANGVHTITVQSNQVIINQDFGNRYSCCPDININLPNSSNRICIGRSLDFMVNCSSGSLNNVVWDFGDGTPDQTGYFVSHSYNALGNYIITLNVDGSNCAPINLTRNIIVDSCIVPCQGCISSFSPFPGKKYLISAWVKEENAPVAKTSYNNPQLFISFPSLSITLPAFTAKGSIIDGWQRIEEEFIIPSGTTDIKIQLGCSGSINDDGVLMSNTCFFDDLRFFPFDGSMKSYVYDPVSLKLVAELDESNYATMFEYDEEGKPIRVKKETERGVMTIQENKNSSKKR